VKTTFQELLTKADAQYKAVEKMHQLYNQTLDFDFDDLYIAQLAVYTGLVQQICALNPRFIESRLKEVMGELAEVDKLWNNGITPEIVARILLLLDTATALGWKQPIPQEPIYTCEVCSFKGHLGADIVEREYYDQVLRRDNTRYECRDIEQCLNRKLGCELVPCVKSVPESSPSLVSPS
jgi:hypothetical protein